LHRNLLTLLVVVDVVGFVLHDLGLEHHEKNKEKEEGVNAANDQSEVADLRDVRGSHIYDFEESAVNCSVV